MKNKLFRQGDVLLDQISSLPKGLKKAKNNILALGETSGHGHQVFGAEVLEDSQGNLYLSVQEEAQLKHLLVASGVWTEEHKDISVPAGLYRVVPQREYNPYLRAIQQVKD